VVANLAVQGGTLDNQVTTVADEQLQRGPGFVTGGFEQGTAGDGGAMDGGEIGVVGFVTGIDALAVLLGDERMEDACLEAGGGEGALDEAVIAAGAFDGDESIVALEFGEGLAHLSDGGFESRPLVLDGGRRDEDAAIEVGEEELGADLGTVEADDAEVFRSDLLDARVERAGGFGNRVGEALPVRAFAGPKGSHRNCLREKG